MGNLKFLDSLTAEFEKLPGVGKKTAQRYAYYVVEKMSIEEAEQFAEEDKIGLWHRVPPFNIETGEFINEEAKINSLFGEKIIDHLIDKHLNNNIR